MLDKELVRGQKELYRDDMNDLDGFIECLKRAKDVTPEDEPLRSSLDRFLKINCPEN
ncbi:MAG: hypothetical protein ACOCTR_01075 [Candidatus Natronoplasma sp.]